MPDEQTLSAEQRLIPEGIASLVLKCVICTGPVPRKRATGRSKDTCGPECQKILRKYRKHIIESSRCPACYHPSTPEERRDFITWRKARGDRRAKPGRPKKPQEEQIVVLGRQMLIRLIEFVEHHPETAWKDEQALAETKQLLADFQKVVDTKAINQSTLPPCGQSAQ